MRALKIKFHENVDSYSVAVVSAVVSSVARNFSKGEGLKFFCVERKNLGEVFGFFFSKNSSKLKKFSEMVGVLAPKTPSGCDTASRNILIFFYMDG